jgi:hypothetical protein
MRAKHGILLPIILLFGVTQAHGRLDDGHNTDDRHFHGDAHLHSWHGYRADDRDFDDRLGRDDLRQDDGHFHGDDRSNDAVRDDSLFDDRRDDLWRDDGRTNDDRDDRGTDDKHWDDHSHDQHHDDKRDDGGDDGYYARWYDDYTRRYDDSVRHTSYDDRLRDDGDDVRDDRSYQTNDDQGDDGRDDDGHLHHHEIVATIDRHMREFDEVVNDPLVAKYKGYLLFAALIPVLFAAFYLFRDNIHFH